MGPRDPFLVAQPERRGRSLLVEVNVQDAAVDFRATTLRTYAGYNQSIRLLLEACARNCERKRTAGANGLASRGCILGEEALAVLIVEVKTIAREVVFAGDLGEKHRAPFGIRRAGSGARPRGCRCENSPMA